MDRLKQLTYRQRNFLLLAVAVIFLVIAWYQAFVPTLEVRAASRALEEKVDLAGDAPQTLKRIKAEMAQLDAVIGNDGQDDIEVQGALLEQVSRYCSQHHLTVESFPEPHRYTEQDFTIATNAVEVKGPFVRSLRLIDELEQHFGAARMTSVRYHAKENLHTHNTQLYATLYLQNISRNP